MLKIERNEGEFLLLDDHILFGFDQVSKGKLAFRVRNVAYLLRDAFPVVDVQFSKGGAPRVTQIGVDQEQAIYCNAGDTITVNGDIAIHVTRKNGSRAVQLSIEAPSTVAIQGGEEAAVRLIRIELARILDGVDGSNPNLGAITFRIRKRRLTGTVPRDDFYYSDSRVLPDAIAEATRRILGTPSIAIVSNAVGQLRYAIERDEYKIVREKLKTGLHAEINQFAEFSPAVLAIAWDPKFVTDEDYAELLEILGDLVRANGGAGVRRLIEEDVGIVGSGVLQP